MLHIYAHSIFQKPWRGHGRDLFWNSWRGHGRGHDVFENRGVNMDTDTEFLKNRGVDMDMDTA